MKNFYQTLLDQIGDEDFSHLEEAFINVVMGKSESSQREFVGIFDSMSHGAYCLSEDLFHFTNFHIKLPEIPFIKVPTQEGFEVREVKKARSLTPKMIESLLRSYDAEEVPTSSKNKLVKKLTKNISDRTTEVFMAKIRLAEASSGRPLTLFYYHTSKTKKQYLLPRNIIAASSETMELYGNPASFISFESIWTERDQRDQIFYLQSRGIEKGVASALVNARNGVLRVNLTKALQAHGNH